MRYRDIGTRVKNRINATTDLNDLWKKLRNEGYMVWEDEDYENNAQAPHHLYHVETGDGYFVADALYTDRKQEDIEWDKEVGCRPFKQDIVRIEY